VVPYSIFAVDEPSASAANPTNLMNGIDLPETFRVDFSQGCDVTLRRPFATPPAAINCPSLHPHESSVGP
ncbi:MAG: hypothetical protein WA813_05735, partial [Beijerinckiaceae bacterium]